MISIEEHKKTLEAKGIYLTDENVGKLLTLKYKFVNLCFDRWIKQTKMSVIAVARITLYGEEDFCIFKLECGYIFYA